MPVRMRHVLSLSGPVAVAIGLSASAAPAQEYDVVDLGPIAGVVAPTEIQTARLNDIVSPGLDPSFALPAVQIVTRIDDDGFSFAERIVGGVSTPIGTLGGQQTILHGVNHFGGAPGRYTRLVGASQDSEGFFRAFVWDEITVSTDLGTLGGDESSAMAINDSRQIAGWAEDGLGVVHAVLWDGVVAPTNLDAAVGQSGPSRANAIDNFGHIAGQAEYTGFAQATVWLRNVDGIIMPIDLGTLGGAQSEAIAIIAARTSAGIAPCRLVAAGWSEVTPGGARRATIWEIDTTTGVVAPTDLGTLDGINSEATDVTHVADGIQPCCVGWSELPAPRRAGRSGRSAVGGIPTHAVIWTDNNTHDIFDLNDLIDPGLGWELARADSINSSGMITGIGLFADQWHAFRLDPTDPPQVCPNDTDKNGEVDVTDLLALLAAWGTCP